MQGTNDIIALKTLISLIGQLTYGGNYWLPNVNRSGISPFLENFVVMGCSHIANTSHENVNIVTFKHTVPSIYMRTRQYFTDLCQQENLPNDTGEVEQLRHYKT